MKKDVESDATHCFIISLNIKQMKKLSGICIIGILVHEIQHVVQRYSDSENESDAEFAEVLTKEMIRFYEKYTKRKLIVKDESRV